MPARQERPRVVRLVEGLSGTVEMFARCSPRFDYGKTRPWTRGTGSVVSAGAGPDAVELRGEVAIAIQDQRLESAFTVSEGERVGFVLTWHSSWEEPPPAIDAAKAVAETDAWWREWSGRSTYRGGWQEEVERSLITLKALTYEPTGGVVAAATTSLPEFLGGVRNWDYRFCWIRDAALSLDAMMAAGYVEEATKWRDWVIRAVAGDPEDLQIMYGVAGERRLDEYELDWLAGLRGIRAGPGRQRRVGSAPARRLRRARRRHLPGSRSSAWRRCQRRWTPRRVSSAGSRSTGATPTTASGRSAVRRRQFVALEGDGVGRGRPCGEDRRGGRARGAARGLRRCATTSTTRSVARATTPSGTRSRSTTGRRSSTPRCC